MRARLYDQEIPLLPSSANGASTRPHAGCRSTIGFVALISSNSKSFARLARADVVTRAGVGTLLLFGAMPF